MTIKYYMVILNSNVTLDSFRKEAEYLRHKETRYVAKCNHVGMFVLDVREDILSTAKPNEDIEKIFL